MRIIKCKQEYRNNTVNTDYNTDFTNYKLQYIHIQFGSAVYVSKTIYDSSLHLIIISNLVRFKQTYSICQ